MLALRIDYPTMHARPLNHGRNRANETILISIGLTGAYAVRVGEKNIFGTLGWYGGE